MNRTSTTIVILHSSQIAYFLLDAITPCFVEFLETIAEKVELKGFKKFNGGLDTSHDLHGECLNERRIDQPVGKHSYYTEFSSAKIMFHVSPMIPATPKDPSRKRHIGNDIVVIIFREEGSKSPLEVSTFCSQFNRMTSEPALY